MFCSVLQTELRPPRELSPQAFGGVVLTSARAAAALARSLEVCTTAYSAASAPAPRPCPLLVAALTSLARLSYVAAGLAVATVLCAWPEDGRRSQARAAHG